ncbi:MAG: nuclear transport factor 2 family protein [Actinomycetota bacterium]
MVIPEDSDAAAVRAANASFYAAFERGDLDAMAELWEHSDRVSVTHPGWPTLHGWARVAASWDAIFRNTPYIQFVLTDEQLQVAGAVAWVTLDENILQASGGDELSGAHVSALNLFVRDGAEWRMVVHHGSPVGG